MLISLEKLLQKGKRAQIGKNTLKTVILRILKTDKLLKKLPNSTNITSVFQSVVLAAITLSDYDLNVLNDDSRNELIQGIANTKIMLCNIAWKYYSKIEFELSDQEVLIMKEVVEVALLHSH